MSQSGTVVTQAQLRALVKAREAAAAAEKASMAVRNEIVALLKAGATVEPGDLDCHIVTLSQQRFNKATLLKILGKEAFAELAAQVDFTHQDFLRVQRNDPLDAPPPPRRFVRTRGSAAAASMSGGDRTRTQPAIGDDISDFGPMKASARTSCRGSG